MRKNKTKENNQSMSVSEFKSWLRGLTEFQDSSWSPNPAQWQAIVNKIYSLQETVEVVNNRTSAPVINQSSSRTSALSEPRKYVDDNDDDSVINRPAPPKMDMSKSVPFAVPMQTDKPAKTIDIDSTNGYKSALV